MTVNEKSLRREGGFKFAIFAAAAGMAFAAIAETWYVRSQITTQNSALLTDRSLWLDADNNPGSGAPDSDDDLIISVNGKVRFKGGEYLGKSIRIGQGDISSAFDWDASFTIILQPNSTGLILENGICRFARQTTAYRIVGPVIVETPASRPFSFMFANYANAKATLTGPVSGDPGTGILFGCCGWWANGKGEICKDSTTFALGDIDNYAGAVIVTSSYENVGASFGTCLEIGSPTNACHITVCRGCVLTTTNATAAARVGALTFLGGARLLLNGDTSARTVGCISATGLVSIADGPLDVRLTAGFKGTDALRVPILAGSAESTFTAADFTLDNVSGVSDGFPDLLHLEVAVDEGTGLRTLYLATYNVEQLTNYTDEGHPSESRSQGSSLTNALAWSDGRVPHTNASYCTTRYLRTLNSPSASYAFPGGSLWLKGGQLRLTVAEFAVPILYSTASSSISLTGDASRELVRLKADRMCFKSGSMDLRAYLGQTLLLEGQLEGSASINMCGINTSSSAPQATYELRGINTNFTGALTVKQAQNNQNITYAVKHQTLVVNDGRNLGGAMAAFNPRALTLAELAFLSVTNQVATVTLADGLNRGVYIGSRACLNVTYGATLDVEQPVLLGGKLWKDGGGTLVLGGAMKHEVSDGGDLTDVPRAESNLVEVLAGTVKVRNADALAGAQVTVAAGACIVVDHAGSESAELARCGIRNVAVDVPFVLGGGASRLPVALTVRDADVAPLAATNAVVTVRGGSVQGVRALLPPPRELNPWPSLPSRYVYLPDVVSGGVTIALESKAYGAVLGIR